MPDFYPLFNSSHKLVFNQDGKPVFARVRNGTITLTLHVVGEALSDGYYPAGSTSYDFTCTLTRTAYKTFTSNRTSMVYGSWVNIGKNYWNYDTYIRLGCEYISFIYMSASAGWRLSASIIFGRSTDQSSYYDSAYPTFYWEKTSNLLVPDGDTTEKYTANPFTNGNMRVTAPSPVTLTFNES